MADLAGRRARTGRRREREGRGLLQALHRRAHRPPRAGGRAAGPRGPLRLPGGAAVEHPASPLITTIPTNDGRGRSYGFDVFLNRPGGGKLTGWTSYTWGRAEREAYGRRYPFEYDRRHAFTLVSSYASHAALGGGRHDAHRVGLPAHGAARRAGGGPRRHARPRCRRHHRRDPAGGDGRGLLEYGVDFGGVGNLNGARLPVFARVDARVTWRPRGAAGRWELYAEVINLLDRQNAGALHPGTGLRPNVRPSGASSRSATRRFRACPRWACGSGSSYLSPVAFAPGRAAKRDPNGSRHPRPALAGLTSAAARTASSRATDASRSGASGGRTAPAGRPTRVIACLIGAGFVSTNIAWASG